MGPISRSTATKSLPQPNLTDKPAPGIQSNITVNGPFTVFGGVRCKAIRCPSGLKAK